MTIKELYELAKKNNMENYTLAIHYDCFDDYYSILNEEVEGVKFDSETKQVNMDIWSEDEIEKIEKGEI